MKDKCSKRSTFDARNITEIIQRKQAADKKGIAFVELSAIDEKIEAARLAHRLAHYDFSADISDTKFDINPKEIQRMKTSMMSSILEKRVQCKLKQCAHHFNIQTYGKGKLLPGYCRYCSLSEAEPLKCCPHCGEISGGSGGCRGPYDIFFDPTKWVWGSSGHEFNQLRCPNLGLNKLETTYPKDAAGQFIHFYASIPRSKCRIRCQLYFDSQLRVR